MQPKISVIIPAFNEAEYLPGCLQALQQVDYPPELLEIIVIDNGSTDDTLQIARDFGVKVLHSTESRISGLRNLGAKETTGAILAFVDADCQVDKTWLNRAITYYTENDIIVWGAPPAVPPDATWVQKAWYLVRQKALPVQEVDWLESMNLFIRKQHFEQIGGFNESLETCEDVDFCYRARKLGRIVSDESIKVIHLGEARDLPEFFRKELWRGRSNYSGVFSHGLKIQELPSLTIPAYFGFLVPVSASIAGFYFDLFGLFLFLFIYSAPTLLALVKLIGKRFEISLRQCLHLVVLLQAYFWSRTFSLVVRS